MDTAQWPQEMALVKPPPPMEDMVSASTRPPQLMERRTRPQKEQALNCPRCNSTNTKFCYYNNYSLTQPRYFCKTCRRYWTEGGSLRNVPVGGGSRKNKRSSSNSSSTINTTTTTSTSSLQAPSSAPNSKKLASDNLISTAISSSTQNSKFLEGHDLNLAFPHHSPNLAGEYGEFHNMNINSTNSSNPSTCSSSSTSAAVSGSALSAMELLRSGGVSSRGLMNPFIPMPIVHEGSAVYPTGGFGLQDFRSTTLNFPVDGISGGSVYGQNNMQEVQEVGDRVLFPFEDLRQVSSNPSEQFEQNRGQGGDSSGFWNGVMGGGAPW